MPRHKPQAAESVEHDVSASILQLNHWHALTLSFRNATHSCSVNLRVRAFWGSAADFSDRGAVFPKSVALDEGGEVGVSPLRSGSFMVSSFMAETCRRGRHWYGGG